MPWKSVFQCTAGSFSERSVTLSTSASKKSKGTWSQSASGTPRKRYFSFVYKSQSICMVKSQNCKNKCFPLFLTGQHLTSNQPNVTAFSHKKYLNMRNEGHRDIIATKELANDNVWCHSSALFCYHFQVGIEGCFLPKKPLCSSTVDRFFPAFPSSFWLLRSLWIVLFFEVVWLGKKGMCLCIPQKLHMLSLCWLTVFDLCLVILLWVFWVLTLL